MITLGRWIFIAGPAVTRPRKMREYHARSVITLRRTRTIVGCTKRFTFLRRSCLSAGIVFGAETDWTTSDIMPSHRSTNPYFRKSNLLA